MRLIILSLIIIAMVVTVVSVDFPIEGTKGTLITATRVATFDEPWAY